MSLVSTLAKVAIGVVIAKGVGSMIQKGEAAPAGRTLDRGPGTGSSFGGTHSSGGRASLPGGLDTIMKDVLAGTPAERGAGRSSVSPGGMSGGGAAADGAPTGPGSGGGLGGLLEELTRGAGPAGRTAPSGGGLDDIIGQLSKGGGLGDLLGGLAGALGGAAATRGTGGAGSAMC